MHLFRTIFDRQLVESNHAPGQVQRSEVSDSGRRLRKMQASATGLTSIAADQPQQDPQAGKKISVLCPVPLF